MVKDTEEKKVKICSYVKFDTAIYLYSQSKAHKKTIGEIIDQLVDKNANGK